ncbi:MAG: transketolase [Parcubacteria group bacterium CG22_combo_CG10-13_8_21_14_all_41_9]|nr:MAG: transketolase [Parcubacteria group bacterium CG22_combo_CG10-13_8_21_14_all_41_9]
MIKQNLLKNILSKRVKQESTRDGYGRGLVALGHENEKIIVLSADLSESTRCKDFSEEFPERFIEVGVAEQNMAGLAAGISLAGYIPFMSSFAVFSPGRNWDQIRVSICYPNLNVKIASTHAGVSTGPDGATHQALEDIALMRCLPNMKVICPADSIEAERATIAAAEIEGPVYIRLTRNVSPVFTQNCGFEIGKASVLSKGVDVSIIGCGPLVYEALSASKELLKNHKIRAEVINLHTIKPIDIKTILSSAKKTNAVVCVEEHQIHGGMGSAVAEVLCERYPVPMRFVGMPDSFGESGEPEELLLKYGLTSDKIVQSCLEVIKKKISIKPVNSRIPQ